MRIEETASRIDEFLRVVVDIRKAWPRKAWKELWFRGEGEDYKENKLRPALYRSPKVGAVRSSAELIEIEDDLFQHFQHNATELAKEESLGEDADDTWGSYFLMQHYGAPTRLLDWSDGALIALHFALRGDHEPAGDRFVFVLDPYWLMEQIEAENDHHRNAKKDWTDYCRKYPTKQLDEDDWDECYIPDEDGHDELPVPNLLLVLELDHFAGRISAQRSRFILFGSSPDYLNGVLEKADARIATITVSKDSVADLRVQLRDAGITESVIYPNLDGLGRELKQLWAERLREPS